MKKRCLSLLLAVAVLCASMPGTSLAVEKNGMSESEESAAEASISMENNQPAEVSAVARASASGVYYEELKIWFDTETGIVTDADSDIVSLELPDRIDGAAVEEIGEYAFAGCANLEEIVLPETLDAIGASAFSDCNALVSIDIPENVKRLEWYTFSGCTSLQEITLPEGLETILDGAFQNCTALTSITLPDSVQSIGNIHGIYETTDIKYYYAGVFKNCTALAEVSLGNGISSIGSQAFNGCTALESIQLPDSVVNMGYGIFYKCTSLQNVTLSSRAQEVSIKMFEGCTGLTEIEIPEGVTSIMSEAFSGCENLNSVSIPESVTSIGDGYYFVGWDSYIYNYGAVFSGCTSLSYLTLPDSVTEIDVNKKNPSSSSASSFEETTILRVKEGSAAEQYAIENGISYIYYFDEKALALRVYAPDGSLLTDGYRVTWYEHDSEIPIANGSTLSVFSAQEQYDYEVTLSESMLGKYVPPVRQQAEMKKVKNQYQTSYTLTARDEVSVSGIVTDAEGTPIRDVVVIFEQRFEEGHKTSTTSTTDADGNYAAVLSDAVTTVSCYADGYAQYRGEEVIFDSAQYDLGTIKMNPLPESRILLSMEKICAAGESNRGKTEEITSFGGLDISLNNETTGEEIGFEAQYPYLYIEESQVKDGDRVCIAAVDSTGGLTAARAVVTYSDVSVPTAQLSFTAYGSFRAEVDRNAMGLVFDADGNFASKYTGSTELASVPMPAGNYTFIVIQNTPLISGLSSLNMLDSLALKEGEDYLRLSVEITDGVITDLGKITVPDFEGTALRYTVAEATGCVAKQSEVPVGALLSVRAEYKILDSYQTSAEKLVLPLPEGVSVIAGSLTVDGFKTNFLTENNTVTVETGKKSAVVRFYISASDAQDYNLNAYLSFQINGRNVMQPVGTVGFTATEINLTASTETGTKSVVVSGSALPQSQIAVFDNDIQVATTTANGVGKWASRFALVKPGTYSKHNIYAEITSIYGVKYHTALHVMAYDKNYCDLKRITIVHGSSEMMMNYLEADTSIPSYVYQPGVPFTFKVEFTGDNVDNVQVAVSTGGSQVTYVPCVYDQENHCFIGTYSGGAVSGVGAVFNQPNGKSVYAFSGICGTQEGKDNSYSPEKKKSVYKEPSEDMEYGIVDTYPKKAGRGKVTLLLDGRLFEPNLTVSLTNGASEYTANQVYWVDHQTAYAVFDLSDAADGIYCVTAQCGEKSDTLQNALTVNSALDEGKASLNINMSQSVKPGEVYAGSVTVTNIGYTDIYAPVIKMTGTNLKFQFDAEGEYVDEAAVFVQNQEGLAGTIAPGETASINFTYVSAKEGKFSLELDDYSSKEGNIYGEVALDKDSGLSDILTANMLSLIGTTYQEYTESMAEMANAVGCSCDDGITVELLESMYEEHARGTFGSDDAFSAVDLISDGLSVSRTFPNSLHRKNTGGIFGIGWSSDYEMRAEYQEGKGTEGIFLTDGDSLIPYVKESDRGDFVDVFTGEERAVRNSDGTIVICTPNEICKTFGSDGTLRSVCDRYGNAVEYRYRDGVLTGVTTSAGDSLAFSYQNGKVSEVTSGVTGETVSYQYEGEYLTAVTTKYGTTKYSYDKDGTGGKRGTLTGILYPDGTSVSYTYDELGRLESVADTTGILTYTYGLNEIIAADKEGNMVRECYDILGNVRWVVDAYGDVCYYEYDQYLYLSEASMGLFEKTQYQYDENGNLTCVLAADGTKVKYAYDTHGGIASVTDQKNQKILYDEDENGMLSAIVYPDGNKESYTYDAKGNIASATDCNGVTAKYEYDDRNHLVRAEYSTGNAIAYTYNDRNNLTQIDEDGEITTIAYDEETGSLAAITYPNGRTVSYGYDALGRRISVTDSEGKVTRYLYNDKGQLSTVYDGETEVISYTYGADGTMSKQQNANGTYTTYTYEKGMLSELCHYRADGAVESRFAYTYDNSGYISSMETEEGVWQYEYDLSGQLAKAISPKGTVTEYAYDAAGNRTCVTTESQNVSYVSNNRNQYLEAGEIQRSYDANGQLLTETSSSGVTSYEWDYRGRLVKVTTQDGHVYEYGYDAFGGRSKVAVDGETTEYVNDPTGSGYALTAYSGDMATSYLIAGGIAAMSTGNELYFYNFNHLGSTTEITGADGNAVNRYTYDQEGNVLIKQEGAENPYTYAGAYGITDYGDGLWYDRSRYVSKVTGSFISMDAAGQYYDLNLYRYVGNNPVNYIDISGEEMLPIEELLEMKEYLRAAGEITPTGAGEISSVWGKMEPGETSGWDTFEKSSVAENAQKQTAKAEVKAKVKAEVKTNIKDVNPFAKGKTNGKDINPFAEGKPQQASDIKKGKLASEIKKKAQVKQAAALAKRQALKQATKESVMAWIAVGGEKAALLLRYLGKLSGWVGIALTIGELIHGLGLDYWLGTKIGELLYPAPPLIEDPGSSSSKITSLSPQIPVSYAIDPSGYVYEGITSNRLRGVKAVIYYEGYPTDEFGQPDEEAGLQEIEWAEAEDYNEVNPQYSDAEGKYGWNVPTGRWKVKFSKEGYEDYWTDWMDVPPEYTDVNINLKSLSAPTAEYIHVYSDCVQIIFSQYMEIDSVTSDTVTVQMEDAVVGTTVQAVDAGYDYGAENQYARIFEFYPEQGLSGDVIVTVNEAFNYCGTAMESESRTLQVAKKPESMDVYVEESVDYGKNTEMFIDITPGETGKYQVVEIKANTPAIADVDQHWIVLDENGHGEVTVSGKMPGTAEFECRARGTALSCTGTITVADCIDVGSVPYPEPDVEQTEISDCEIFLEYVGTVYTGNVLEPSVTIADGDLALEQGKDYSVTYSNNINAGTAMITITGMGDYTGSATENFTIDKADQVVNASVFPAIIQRGSSAQITASGIGNLSYQSDKPAIASVNDSGIVKGLTAGAVVITVTAEGDKNHNSGNAKVSVTVTPDSAGLPDSTQQSSIPVTSVPVDARTITATNVVRTASKKVQKFSLGASISAGSLTYSSNNKSVKVDSSGKITIVKNFVGRAVITIYAAAVGNYKAISKTITVTVNPAGVKFFKVKNSAGKRILVTWKKNAKASGYEIQYSTNRRFVGSVKIAKIKKASTTKKTLSKLKKGKAYYVRIRVYKIVSGAKYYSKWSGRKRVKVKK